VKKGIPFSVSILTLLSLIVLPLAAGLLVLGWRTAGSLERSNVELRVAALEAAVTDWLTGNMRTAAEVDQMLGDAPSFAFDAGATFDNERTRQLVAVLDRHPAIEAAYAGYADGKFIYAGRTNMLGSALRHELKAPEGEGILLRTIDVVDGERREAWTFRVDGHTSQSMRPTEFDPRKRPWYRGALTARAPVTTEPYEFTQSGAMGVTAATPTGDGRGVIGSDFTLAALSRVLADYKISPNSIVVVATGVGNVMAESPRCPVGDASCLPENATVRDLVRDEIAGVAQRSRSYGSREVEIEGRMYVLMVNAMPAVMGTNFISGVLVPTIEISAASRGLIQQSAIVGAAAATVAILAALLVSLVLSRSIARIAAKTERIRDLDFSDRTPVVSRIGEILRLSSAVESMREGLEVFGRYVSKDLVRQIMKSPESAGVGGVRRDLTVLFTDIEGFSHLSEGMAPELLTSRLSRYFETLGGPITAHKGTIDKYIGDSIMAFWNAPLPDDNHAANACHAALEAAAAGRRLANKWRAVGRQGFRTRFGLHTGLAVVGNVGTTDRINYTLVGAMASQASRLEGLNKMYGTEILASGEVLRLTADQFVWRHLDRVVPAGTTELLDIHELLGVRGDGHHAAFLEQWNQGHAAYCEQRFTEAIVHFDRAAELRPDDGPCGVYIKRCRKLVCEGPPMNWDGAWRFDTK
jgi:adenylate cyclase